MSARPRRSPRRPATSDGSGGPDLPGPPPAHAQSTIDEAVETGERAIAIAAELGDLSLQIAATDVRPQSYHEMGAVPARDRAAPCEHRDARGDARPRTSGPAPSRPRSCREVPRLVSELAGRLLRGDRASRRKRSGSPKSSTIQAPDASMRWRNGLVYALKGDVSRRSPSIERSLEISRRLGLRPHLACSAFLGPCVRARRTAPTRRSPAGAVAGRRPRHRAPCRARRSGPAGWPARTSRPGASPTPSGRPTAPSRWAGSTRSAASRGTRCASLATSSLQARARTPTTPKTSTARRSPSPRSWGCARSRPTRHLSLGKLYRRAGRDHEARAELNVAIDLYLSMEMTHWLPEAEAELAQVAEAVG